MPDYSDLDAIRAEIAATVDYDVPPGDVGKCRRFVAACRAYLTLVPASVSEAGGASSRSVTQDLSRYQNLMEKAEAWLAANDSGGGSSTRYFQTSGDFRS